MKRAKYEIGRINGKPYKLRFDKLGNQQGCDYEYRNVWLWFLWIDGYYQGNFRLKREALSHAETI